jgi:tripartite-type tricarboxylate transporter receptor subunit TctC
MDGMRYPWSGGVPSPSGPAAGFIAAVARGRRTHPAAAAHEIASSPAAAGRRRSGSPRSFVVLLAVLVAAVTLTPAAPCAAFPERPIHVIVPFPAGGAVDLVTRLVTRQITAARGWSFVIDNRGAAGGIVATDAGAKAPADGYTLLVTSPNHTITAALKGRLPYDWEHDVVPVALMAGVPELLVSHPAAPFDSFAGFIAYAKQNPGKLIYASAGNGTLPHVTMELLKRRAGLDVLHVPYRGAAPALTDLLAGVVHVKLDAYATARDHVAAGKLRALAIGSGRRSPVMPDLPTVAEQGFPGYEGVLWIGLMAPSGVPGEAVDLLAAAAGEAVRSDEIAARFHNDGIEPIGGGAADFAALIRREVAQWRELAREAQMQVE